MTYYFPEMVRVHHGRGSEIQPPFDDNWSDLVKLHWHAAALRVDTGLEIQVSVSNSTRGGVLVPGLFCIFGPGFSVAAYDLAEAWTYINGIQTGAALARASR